VEPIVAFGSSQLISLLNNKGGIGWSLVIGVIAALSVEAGPFCSADPPAEPSITADEYRALLELAPADVLLTATGKLKDLLLRMIWWEICECKTMATPPFPPNTLAPPAGIQVPDYSTTPCLQPRLRINAGPGLTAQDESTNITRQLFPNFEFSTSVAGSGVPAQTIAKRPSAWTTIFGTMDYVSGTAPQANEGFGALIQTYGSARTPVSTILDNVVNNVGNQHDRDPETGTRSFTPADVWFSVNTVSGASVTTTGIADWSVTIGCAAGTPATISCGADPVLVAMLNQLLELGLRTRQDLTLLQRYVLPFAYVPGTVHSGLSLTGAAAVARSVGLLIDVIAFPAGNKQLIGEPPYIFDLGWVSVVTPDGMVDEIRLTREHTTWLSKLIPSATSVGWGLRDGVIINVTELRAEP
jgi:hypothetical protein